MNWRSFAIAIDVTLAELPLEAFLPADAEPRASRACGPSAAEPIPRTAYGRVAAPSLGVDSRGTGPIDQRVAVAGSRCTGASQSMR